MPGLAGAVLGGRLLGQHEALRLRQGPDLGLRPQHDAAKDPRADDPYAAANSAGQCAPVGLYRHPNSISDFWQAVSSLEFPFSQRLAAVCGICVHAQLPL